MWCKGLQGKESQTPHGLNSPKAGPIYLSTCKDHQYSQMLQFQLNNQKGDIYAGFSNGQYLLLPPPPTHSSFLSYLRTDRETDGQTPDSCRAPFPNRLKGNKTDMVSQKD